MEFNLLKDRYPHHKIRSLAKRSDRRDSFRRRQALLEIGTLKFVAILIGEADVHSLYLHAQRNKTNYLGLLFMIAPTVGGLMLWPILMPIFNLYMAGFAVYYLAFGLRTLPNLRFQRLRSVVAVCTPSEPFPYRTGWDAIGMALLLFGICYISLYTYLNIPLDVWNRMLWLVPMPFINSWTINALIYCAIKRRRPYNWPALTKWGFAIVGLGVLNTVAYLLLLREIS